jgi:hypothetical protein
VERYEYKLVPTPKQSAIFKGLPKSGDAFAQTLGHGMNELGRDGWEFLRTETVVEKRNVLVISSRKCRHDYMVYRRPLRSTGLTMDEPVRSRRVKPVNVPDAAELKSRINALVTDDAAKLASDTRPSAQILTPFDVIRSKLN